MKIKTLKTWNELIICPECQSLERAEVVHCGFLWPIYSHICQKCGYAITESEWCTLDDYMSNQVASLAYFWQQRGWSYIEGDDQHFRQAGRPYGYMSISDAIHQAASTEEVPF